MVAGGLNRTNVNASACDSLGTSCATLALFLIAAISVLLAGCATQPPAPTAVPRPPQATSVVGVASWYGPGFNGHRTSSGAVYDQENLTAASTLFPLGTHLLVTNLTNRRSVEVTVNDHGPYVTGRQLDLSHKAATVLGMIGPGTAQVRMDVLQTPPGGPALGQRYFVQVGTFADADNARLLQQRLAVSYSDVRIETAYVGANRYYRVRMGAFMNRQAARVRAERVADSGYSAVIITE